MLRGRASCLNRLMERCDEEVLTEMRNLPHVGRDLLYADAARFDIIVVAIGKKTDLAGADGL